MAEQGEIPDHVNQIRTRVVLESDIVKNTAATNFPNTYPDIDDSWRHEDFCQKFKVKVYRLTDMEMEFDLIGIDASIANAFRRILIAEVPTMAIEHVFVFNNTSIIADEVLAHRLGLIPIYADPGKFDIKRPGDNATDANTLVFQLKISCEQKPDARPDETDPNRKFINANVYSGDLLWIPQGDQADRFKDENAIRPVVEDVLLAKLRPGQVIDLESTASYRLLPEITIKQEIVGDLADRFAACFAPGVVEVKKEKGVKRASIVNPRRDTVSREVLRHKEFQDIVQLSRVRDHFIFNVESIGILPPEKLFMHSVEILVEKCVLLREALERKIEDSMQE
ncbi:6493_t:CDS:10 [Paraglomus occultum]|uniref:DNA-directed RNA polymerases I and III subunit RPAC1 n=1 Tax=Paraglomus occultum TaxID=144539 RepID=A0A9N8YVG7_9GLOM|nr:6493_t:CDS:10 [Paraglomus occultum]